MPVFRETITLTALNLRALPKRLFSSAVTVVGVSGVVAVLVALLGVSQGLSRMATQDVSPRRVIVLSGNAPAEYLGDFSQQQIAAIADAPGVARDAADQPRVVPMAVAILQAQKLGDGSSSDIVVRGLSPADWSVLAPTKVVAGRLYRAGFRELVVGQAVARRFRNFGLRDRIKIGGAEWTVVGVAAGGGMNENTIFGDDRSLLSSLKRGDYQSVLVDLTDPGTFPAFRDAVRLDPRVSGRAMRQQDYIGAQVQQLHAVLNFLAYFVGSIMAIGATVAAVNVMFASIDARRREIATLRAIGFGSAAVVLATLAEALVLCIPAAGLGGAVAYLVFNGSAAAANAMSFTIAILPPTLAIGAAWALGIGLLGGLAPAIVAARLPVSSALRAT